MINHPFDPVFDKRSRVLILGTFPSKKSREFGFYYGHPQNRFWKTIAYLTQTTPIPVKIFDKKETLLKNGIAVWDIVKSCDIEGSSDNKIVNEEPNDLSLILKNSDVRKIFANGGKAYELCKKYSIDAIRLPSTSPANASHSFEKLITAWSLILYDLKDF